jgi:hypothetical protein
MSSEKKKTNKLAREPTFTKKKKKTETARRRRLEKKGE